MRNGGQASRQQVLIAALICLWPLVTPAKNADTRHDEWPLSPSLKQELPAIHSDDVGADSHAVTSDETPTSASPMEWLREKRNYWGNIVDQTGRRLDGFFADSDAIQRNNDSFLKLGLVARQEKGGRSYLEPIIKFRLDLPTLEERLKLVFESEADETKTLAEKNRERTDAVQSEVKESATAALRYQAPVKKRWSASTSVGVDLEIPPDFFWRARGRYRWEINRAWTFELRQRLYYFHKEGWGETTQFNLERSSTRYVFRSTTEARYLHDERRMEFAQTWSFLRELSAIRAINYQFGVLAENKPKRTVTNYFVSTIYRRKLSQEWLFYELVPAVSFPRDDSYTLSPSLTAKIEIVFSAPR